MSIYTMLGSALLAEWAADEPATIYEDIGGTNAAEDGDAVASWRSTSNGTLSLLATQSTGANQPIYRANYASSGYPAVEFDGTNDGLLIPHNAAFNITNLTVFAVAQADVGGYKFLWSRLSSGAWTNGHMLFHNNVANQVRFAAPIYNTNAADRTITLGTRRMYCGRKNGVTVSMIGEDGSVSGTANTSSVTSHSQDGGIGNGGGIGGNFPWDGGIQHLIICDGSCDLSVIDNVMYELGQRWGISYTEPLVTEGGGSTVIVIED